MRKKMFKIGIILALFFMIITGCNQNQIKDKIDIIYIDPPYETNLIQDSLKTILEKKIISDEGIIILETDDEKRILKQLEKFEVEVIDDRKYGRANILFVKPNIDLRKG